VTDFVNLKIKTVQSFRDAHRGRVCTYVFIWVIDHTWVYTFILCFYKKCCSLEARCVSSSNSPASWLCRWPFLNGLQSERPNGCGLLCSLGLGGCKLIPEWTRLRKRKGNNVIGKEPNILARTKGQGRPFQNHLLFPRRLPSRETTTIRSRRRRLVPISPPSSERPQKETSRSPVADRTVPHTHTSLPKSTRILRRLGLQRSLLAGGTGRHPLPCPVPRLPAGTTLLAVASGPASSFILV
jgi:hypothetical protein